MSRTVRFVHAADLHLGAPFKGVAADDEQVRHALVEAPYRALGAIVDLCVRERVDFLVIAGDVYNSAERPIRPQLALMDAARALEDVGVRIFVAHGNHDPAADAPALVGLPGNVHVFAHARVDRVVVECDGEPLCAVYGRSFARREVKDNLARSFSREPGDALAIGVLHANVGARAGYDDYAPCSASDLAAADMDYWALGHIHEPGVVSETPWAVYAGAPQGMDPTQTGERGCYLVTAEPGHVSAEFVPLASLIWDARTVELDEADTLDVVEDRIAETCAVVSRAWGRPSIVRLTLTGRGEAHAALSAAGAQGEMLARVRERALGLDPWVWVDRISDRTAPAIDLDLVRQGADLAADIVRIADELLADPDAARAAIESLVEPLSSKLRQAGIDAVAALDPVSVVERARDRVLDAVLAKEGL